MKKRYLIISIVSMLVLIVGVSVAIKDGEVKTDSLMPILDSSKETKANTQTFTVERTSDSSIKTACYTVYLVIDNIGENLKNKFFKYELLSNNNIISSGDFNNINNQDKIELVTKQKITEETGRNTYTLRLWFSYDEVEDQTKYLQGEENTRTFTGHIYVSGNTGECPKTTAEKLVDKWTEEYGEIGKRTDFSTTYTEPSIFYEDGDFTEGGNKVYYFAGAVTNNWVKFAGYYWRIIRTNEDGSLRLLYGGSAADKGANDNQYIGSTRTYNGTYSNTMYVGFKYGSTGSLSSNRTNGNNSSILGTDGDTHDTGSDVTLNGWYNQNIKPTYDTYISKTAVYCNDRGTSSYNLSSTMYYAAYDRLNSNKRPSYKCGVKVNGTSYSGLYDSTQAEEDKFSGMNSKAKLTNPIGLITADEIVFAGGKYGTSLSSPYAYYYNNADGTKSATGSNYWWTMSPYNFISGYAYVSSVYGSNYPGYLGSDGVYGTGAVRPVVSLKSCVQFTGDGDGSVDNPYTVSIDDTCASADN